MWLLIHAGIKVNAWDFLHHGDGFWKAYMSNTMAAAEGLVKQGARASAVMALTQFPGIHVQNIFLSKLPPQLNFHTDCNQQIQIIF